MLSLFINVVMVILTTFLIKEPEPLLERILFSPLKKKTRFLEESKIEELVKKYANFLPMINLTKKKTSPTGNPYGIKPLKMLRKKNTKTL